MATIFKTASFKLWQKLTKALPLGPILPSIIPKEGGTKVLGFAPQGGSEHALVSWRMPFSYPWWLKKWQSPARSCLRWCRATSSWWRPAAAWDPGRSSARQCRCRPGCRICRPCAWWSRPGAEPQWVWGWAQGLSGFDTGKQSTKQSPYC